jgi:hypothetical protein
VNQIEREIIHEMAMDEAIASRRVLLARVDKELAWAERLLLEFDADPVDPANRPDIAMTEYNFRDKVRDPCDQRDRLVRWLGEKDSNLRHPSRSLAAWTVRAPPGRWSRTMGAWAHPQDVTGGCSTAPRA